MSLISNSDPLGIAGTLIADKYRIDRAVGQGGFSVVYLAEHTIWKQPVALKCFTLLANAPPDQREALLQGFIQEGKLMAELSSRSAAIVQARDIGTFTAPNGQWLPYMVLEWLDGKPLDLLLEEETRDQLPPRNLYEMLALLEPAAIALEIVHSRGIAHRDIKPANLFVIGDRAAGRRLREDPRLRHRQGDGGACGSFRPRWRRQASDDHRLHAELRRARSNSVARTARQDPGRTFSRSRSSWSSCCCGGVPALRKGTTTSSSRLPAAIPRVPADAARLR